MNCSDRYSEQVFSIGIIAAVPQPIVVDEDLRNLPAKAVLDWEPGGAVRHPPLGHLLVRDRHGPMSRCRFGMRARGMTPLDVPATVKLVRIHIHGRSPWISRRGFATWA